MNIFLKKHMVQLHFMRAAIFDNGENTEKICKILIDAGWNAAHKDKR